MRGARRLLAGLLLAGLAVAGCGSGRPPAAAVPSPTPLPAPPATSAAPGPTGPVASTPAPTAPSSSRPPTSAAPAPPGPTSGAPTALLQLGGQGPAVLAVQQRLARLGYWLGEADGVFGNLTQQAVYALQKAAGLERDGVVGPRTLAALDAGVRPAPRSRTGHVIEIDQERQLLLVVDQGRLAWTFNTSTGSGGSYVWAGQTYLAVTPSGTFTVFRQVDGEDVSPLGVLWRPKYFNGGIAVHGYDYVPPYPASHGCVRVSDPAIDFVWAAQLAPLGTPVWVY